MTDHLVLDVERLIHKEDSKEPGVGIGSAPSPPSSPSDPNNCGETEPLLKQVVECRICQEEDCVKNLESPCACSGSLKFAHRTCVQRWCNEKGDITCEICHELFKPDYVAPPRTNRDESTVEISGGWSITGAHVDLHDPRFIAMAQRHFLEDEYDEYASTSTSAAAFCRSIFLILMAFLLLRHTLTMTNSDDDEDASTMFSLFLLRAAGFLLPCYIMAWAISILQRQRQSQEAVIRVPTEVSVILEPGNGRGMQFSVTPEPPSSPQSGAAPVE